MRTLTRLFMLRVFANCEYLRAGHTEWLDCAVTREDNCGDAGMAK